MQELCLLSDLLNSLNFSNASFLGCIVHAPQHSVTESILLLSSLSPLLKTSDQTLAAHPYIDLNSPLSCVTVGGDASGCLPLLSLLAILSWFFTGSITIQGAKKQLSPCPCSIFLFLLSLKLLYPVPFLSPEVPVEFWSWIHKQADFLSTVKSIRQVTSLQSVSCFSWGDEFCRVGMQGAPEGRVEGRDQTSGADKHCYLLK